MRVVGSMTTLPDRISSIKIPIKYILRQSVPLDVLYLHIPKKTLKNKEYDIPHGSVTVDPWRERGHATYWYGYSQ